MKKPKIKLPKIHIPKAEIFMLIGLGGMGYGLHLYKPWVAFSSVGAILFLIGLFGNGE